MHNRLQQEVAMGYTLISGYSFSFSRFLSSLVNKQFPASASALLQISLQLHSTVTSPCLASHSAIFLSMQHPVHDLSAAFSSL
jgi:hypothetical protein